MAANRVRLRGTGPSLVEGLSQPDSFLRFLKTWGGTWMWSNICNEGKDLRWVVEAVANGTAIWVTDGSYNREVAPHVSGAGWLVYCTRCGKKLFGYFSERSPHAGSYRAELLGLLAIHIFLAALEQFYDLPWSAGKICCDNQGALYKSKLYRRRIPVGASQADIKRALRNVKTGLKATLTYEWVESHQDRYKLWYHLTTEQQLNCYCDSLAKEAVLQGMTAPRTGKQRLPRESAAVFIQGCKQTSDVSTAARFALGMADAERFYTAPLPQPTERGRKGGGGLGWSKQSFDAVAWRELDLTLSKKGQMYRQWLAKQCSGFCGTQSMVCRWDATRDDRCPDCGRRETASHLNLCPDKDRTQLLADMSTKLGGWLEEHYTHPELAYWIPRYIRLRGTRRLLDFPFHSRAMQRVAESQDLIPWTSFMEGKLSEEIFKLQSSTLAASPSRLTITDWATQVISKILHISHAQWIFRNVSLHDTREGYLRTKERNKVLAEIDRISQTDPDSIPERSRYLLEIDFATIPHATAEAQSYWLFAMKAAITAGRRTARSSRQATARQRRARGGAEQHRQVRIHDSNGRQMLGGASMAARGHRRHSSRQISTPRRQWVVTGAEATLREIEGDLGTGSAGQRQRRSRGAGDAERRDNRRRKPD